MSVFSIYLQDNGFQAVSLPLTAAIGIRMCGIAGFWRHSDTRTAEWRETVALQMADALAHRGPDDRGAWTAAAGIALAHRRLSIQDVSSFGHQPMQSECGRYTVVYNGEIYNFLELRQQLLGLGHTFAGHSDTEILLASVAEWGVEKALQKFNGMFAFALWDSEAEQLTLARDRVGKKPLYFGWAGDNFIFASELKALRLHPDFTADIDFNAVSLYLRHNYIPCPHSIYKRIQKLPAGCYVTFTASDLWTTAELSDHIKYYWDHHQVALNCVADPFLGNFEAASEKLSELLRASVQRRLIADVPLGMLLSGGIDSTLVTAIAQSDRDIPLNTFSIGFNDEKISEAEHASKIASFLGTQHTELYLNGDEALDVIPLLSQINDEPMGDSSQIPTYLVSKLARQHVTVALSGDGGDELFYGYKRYLSSRKIAGLQQRLPSGINAMLAATCELLDGRSVAESKWLTHAQCFRAQHALDVYESRMAKYLQPEKLMATVAEENFSISQRLRAESNLSVEMQMMLLDFGSYLVDDILVKVDRAGMRESLELRNPLLDYSIVEFAWRLPQEFKSQGNSQKHILKQLLETLVPRKLTERPKQGFSPPLKTWLHGPLRSWADSLLAPERLESEGVFNPAVVDGLWQACKRNPDKGLSKIWTLLMFQVWYEGNILSNRR